VVEIVALRAKKMCVSAPWQLVYNSYARPCNYRDNTRLSTYSSENSWLRETQKTRVEWAIEQGYLNFLKIQNPF
jgi:hypothetical protein